MAGHRRLVAGVDRFGDVDEGIAAVAVGGVAGPARQLFQGETGRLDVVGEGCRQAR